MKERILLVRTGIAIIALGFVVARFGLFLKEISPLQQAATPVHFSSVIGVALILVGGFMELLALKRFVKNQERIRMQSYEPAPPRWLKPSSAWQFSFCHFDYRLSPIECLTLVFFVSVQANHSEAARGGAKYQSS
jgi:uncharacterized membrane protein YidH (DUF202 family)